METKAWKPAGLLAPVRGVVRTIRGGARARAAERQLFSLSDHTLRDIGLTRAEIPYVAREMETRRVN